MHKFNEWKASLVVMLTTLALEKNSFGRTKKEVPVITAIIGLLTAASSFHDVFQALRAVLPFSDHKLKTTLEKLERVDKVRRYGTGGSSELLMDLYAECVDDEGKTAQIAKQVDEAICAASLFIREGHEARGGYLNHWQLRLYQLATLSHRTRQ